MKLNILLESKQISKKRAKDIGNQLGIDWKQISLDQFTMGLNIESEHGLKDPETNITDDDPIKTGKIAWAHLKENKQYYSKLEQLHL